MKMTVKQYAEKRGITTNAVINRLCKKLPLPGVKSASKLSRDWVLNVDLKELSAYTQKKDKINRVFL